MKTNTTKRNRQELSAAELAKVAGGVMPREDGGGCTDPPGNPFGNILGSLGR